MSEPLRNIKLEPTNNKAREVYDILVVDRSSSMSYQKDTTITGINAYVKKLQEDAESLKIPTFLAVIFFDTEVEVMFDFTDVKEFVQLNTHNYVPNGMTALNDGVGKAIEMLQTKFKGRETDENIDVTVTVFTDGEENMSKKYPGRSNLALKGLVKELEDSYKWSFAFMGGGSLEQATEQARGLGISGQSVMSYSIGAAGAAGPQGAIGDTLGRAKSMRTMAFARGAEKTSGGYFTGVNTLPVDITPIPALFDPGVVTQLYQDNQTTTAIEVEDSSSADNSTTSDSSDCTSDCGCDCSSSD